MKTLTKKRVVLALVLIASVAYSVLPSTVIASPALRLNSAVVTNIVDSLKLDSSISSGQVETVSVGQIQPTKFEISSEITDFSIMLAIMLSVLHLLLPSVVGNQNFRHKH